MLRITHPKRLGAGFAFAFLAFMVFPITSIGAIGDPESISKTGLYSNQSLGLSLAGITSTGEIILEIPTTSLEGIAGTGLRGIAGTGLR